MGKTLGSILSIVVGSVLEVVPGAQAIGASLVLSGVAGLIGAALQKSPTVQPPETTETAMKSPTPPRVSAYGLSRLYGAYILFDTDAQSCAEDVFAIHEGRMDGPDTFYLGDTALPAVAGVTNGAEDGSYSAGNVEIDFRFGLATETPYQQIVGRLPGTWSSSHRGDGIVTAMVIWQPVKTDQYSKIYPNGQPAFSMAARWQPVFDWRDGSQSVTDETTWKWSENTILHLAHYLLVRDGKDWATQFLPTLAYWTAAANDCDVPMPLTGWQTYTTTTLQPGATVLVVDSVNGLQPGMSVTIAAKATTGQPQTRTVQAVGAQTSAGATITLTGGLDYKVFSGAQVSWVGGNATEPRYRSCVAHKHTDDHKSVIAGILACCDGWLSPRSDGALMVFSGRISTPTVAVGPDQIVSYSLQDGIDEEDAVNQLTVTYVSQNHQFNTVDTDPWEDGDDIAARGKVLSQQFANQVPSHAQARRLAKRAMAKIMAPMRGSVTTNSAGRVVRGQRFVALNLTDAGTTFFSGPVEITKLTRNIATGGVTFDWISVDPNVDAWNPATEEGSPASVGGRIAPAPLDAPTIASAAKDYAALNGDGSGVRIAINGSGPDRADLTWYARWRVQGSAVWNEDRYPDLAAGPAVTIETGFVPSASAIQVEIAYLVSDGRVSPYSAPFLVNTQTPAPLKDAILTAQEAANAALADLARIGSDGWLSAGSEKRQAVQDFAAIVDEGPSIDAQADQQGVSRTAYDAARTNLAGYLSALSPAWSDTTQDTSIDAQQWVALWTAVYTAKVEVLNAIAAKAATTSTWDGVTGAGKDALIAQAAAAKGEADAAVADLARIGSDGWLNAGSEKRQAVLDFVAIVDEGPSLDGQADALGVSRTDLDGARDALATYLSSLSPAWSDTTQDTAINPATWNGKWSDYYYARVALLTALAAKAATSATWDGVSGSGKDALLAEVAAIGSDGVLSRGEKPQLYRDWSDLFQVWTSLDAKAAGLGLAPSERADALAKMSDANSYLNNLSPSWTDNSQNTPIDAAEFQNKWVAATGSVASLQAAIQGQPGKDGVSPSAKYSAEPITGEATLQYSNPVPLDNGQTVSLLARLSASNDSTSGPTSATVAMQQQYSTDGGASWAVMGGGSSSQTIVRGNSYDFDQTGTYTNNSGGRQLVYLRTVATRTGSSNVTYSSGFQQPS